MNRSQKIVFSTTLRKAKWENTTIIKKNIVEEIKKVKNTPGPDLTILGSGSIVTQFAEAGLIDSYQIMIDPVVLGSGTPMFKGLKGTLNLKLVESKVFKSGIVLVRYEPVSGDF